MPKPLGRRIQRMTGVAQAFVPGHITGFFTTHRDADPTKTGSQGGGVCLSDGVTVTVEPAAEPQVLLNDEPLDIGAVTRVLDTLQVNATVRGETPLPLGSGFGVSGAMALGTAFAANAAFDRQLSANELTTIAHGAEVQAGTGLGDVVAQARGGVPIRLEPGGPQHNYLDGIPATARIEYHVLGGLSTDDVLGGDTTDITAAGKQALSQVVKEPTLPSFMQASRSFSRESGLLTDEVQSVISDVAQADGDAAMAMLGETIFALGTGLSDAGYDPRVCEVHHPGAMMTQP